MSDYKSHGGKPIEFCGDQDGWIAVGSLSSDSPNSPCFPNVVLLGMGLGESGKDHPSNIAAMLTIDQATDLCGRLTAAMTVDRPAPTTDPAPGLDLDAIEKLRDLWDAWDRGSMIGMADTINAIRPALDEVRALRARLAESTAAAVALAAKLAEAKRLGLLACDILIVDTVECAAYRAALEAL